MSDPATSNAGSSAGESPAGGAGSGPESGHESRAGAPREEADPPAGTEEGSDKSESPQHESSEEDESVEGSVARENAKPNQGSADGSAAQQSSQAHDDPDESLSTDREESVASATADIRGASVAGDMEDEFDASRIRTPHQLRVYRRMPAYRYRMPAMQKWKRITHSIILWLRLYHFHSSQVREILRYFSDADLLVDALEETNFEELLFSVYSFKPNKQARVNHKTLNIMRISPSERPAGDVRPIEAGLRGYETFRKYPPNILRKIAEKAWFQEFDRHSVIVREGDHPLYYYVILYGSALVSIIDREKMIARAAAILNRGDSFGELAIVDRTKRASTVIAREKCGLLVLEDRDYLAIFMHGGVQFLDNNFVRNHLLFNGFDLGVLKANPRLVKLNYFSPGVTIVEDSRLSFWVFMVISGKATVKMAVHRSVLQREAETVVDRDEQERQDLLAEYRGGGIGHRTLIRRNWRQHLLRQDRLSRRPEFEGNLEQRQLGLARQGGMARELSQLGRETTRIGAGDKSVRLPPLTKAYLAAPTLATESHQTERQPAEIAQKPVQKITYVTGRDAVLGKRTLATDLNREYYEQVEMKLLMGEFEDESLFEYMPVQVLERGMLFGFANHFFDNQPTLKLVSKGCELLCIRRELYFENANEITLFGVGKSLRPYPSELAVLSKNKEVQAWTTVRGKYYSQTVTNLVKEGVDIHDALSRFPPIRMTPR